VDSKPIPPPLKPYPHSIMRPLAKGYGNMTKPPNNPLRSAWRIGIYALGSIESRAAARALLSDKSKEDTIIEIIFVSPHGNKTDGPKLKISG
jgi:hypothetical protein